MNTHLINNYAGKFDVTFVKGKRAKLYDDSGKDYIDFASGIAVNSVGHAHPQWVAAVVEQAAKLAHVSNLYHTQPAQKLAKKLTEISGMDKVFFCNSGAEANEAAIKLARKYSHDKYGEGRHVIVTLENSFHGRTMAALSATGQPKFHQHFMPFVEGFVHILVHDMQALNALPDNVCAIMVEPIRGEGGILPLQPEYWQTLRQLCDKNDWLLIADEVQCGVGRTGKWFGYQQLGADPDVVTVAKGVAGGLPLGGMLTNAKCSDTFSPGTHGTTFGGNPICAAAALTTLEIIERELPNIPAKEKILRDALAGLPNSGEIQGMGLMLGMTVGENVRAVVENCLKNGVVTLTCGGDQLRLLPPLTITQDEMVQGIERLRSAW